MNLLVFMMFSRLWSCKAHVGAGLFMSAHVSVSLGGNVGSDHAFCLLSSGVGGLSVVCLDCGDDGLEVIDLMDLDLVGDECDGRVRIGLDLGGVLLRCW